MKNSRVRIFGGASAHVQAAILRAVVRGTRPTGHRGVQRATWALGKYFAADNHALVRLHSGDHIRVFLNDGYWTKLLDPTFRYEPEITWFLDRALSPQTLFIDGGANIGLWSLLARNHARRTVAVEATPPTFSRLQSNLELNRAEVASIPAAIWHTGNMELTIDVQLHKHANASLRGQDQEVKTSDWISYSTGSVTIDELVATYSPEPDSPVVMKLDVEGAEIAAIHGARTTLREREFLLLYEDHGKDVASSVSGHLIELGMEIRAAGRDQPLTLDEISSMKVDRTKGYNFAAHRRSSSLGECLNRRPGPT